MRLNVQGEISALRLGMKLFIYCKLLHEKGRRFNKSRVISFGFRVPFHTNWPNDTKKKREKRSLNWDIIVAVTFFSSSSLFLFIIGFFSAQNFYWDRWISWKPSRFRRWNLVLLIFSRRVLIRILWKTKIIRNSYKQTATAKNTKT